MDNDKLHLYDEYQDFYTMSKENEIFSQYCEKVFGIDFSQDGFSNKKQVDDLLSNTKIKRDSVILDIGCGNGGMCEYIHEITGATVYGFDYSSFAIEKAKQRAGTMTNHMLFDVGIIGEKQYPPESFTTILSIDTLYFAKDLSHFINQIYGWLKPQGIIAAYYSEFRFDNETPVEKLQKDNTDLALALNQLQLSYDVIDYTKDHFEHMKHKRITAVAMKEDFFNSNLERYYNNAISQSVDVNMPYNEFLRFSSRYMYIIKKP